jgi:tetratricopeptide (TPR) repeat protein
VERRGSTPPDKALPRAYLARGRFLLQMGKYDRARPDLEYVVQKDFKSPDPWLYMGLENLATHNCHEGRGDLEKAAELMSTPLATLVKEHQAFIDKTPCKDDVLN